MTSTLTRTSQAVAEWSKLFTCQATETYTGSVTFMKQLTVVAVSTITYLKNAFPEDNYTIDQFGGLKIRVLKKKCDDELAQFLMTALTQAFEAFDKKYLHQIALCFYEERCCPENLVEYHLFEYGYGEGEGASLSVRSAARGGGETSVTLDAVRDRTVMLLRACMVMLSNTRLPKTYDVSLRLYYNDDAPEDYQAPGFSAAAEAGADEVAAGAGRVRLGSVSTPWHRVQLHTFHRDMRAEASESTTALSQRPAESASSGCEAATGEAGAAAQSPAAPPRAPVRCECGRDDTHAHMLLCGWCGCTQHAVCYGVRPAAPPHPPPHCCVPCAERGAGVCADAGLLRASNRTCYAIFRRALWWVWARALGGAARVSAGAVGGALALNAPSARKLLRVLRAHGVLAQDPPLDTETEVDVVPAQLETTLERFFLALPSPLSGSDAGGSGAREGVSPADDAALAEYRAALAPLAAAPPPPPLPSPPAPRKRKQPAVGVKTKRMKKAD